MALNLTPMPAVPQLKEFSLWNFLTAIRAFIQSLIERYEEDEWHYPNLINSWERYSTTFPAARYRKDPSGTVHLSGLIKSGTPGSSETANAFELPTGYRPALRILLTTTSNAGLSRLDIFPTGEVRPISGGSTWYSLDGLTFKAEQ